MPSSRLLDATRASAKAPIPRRAIGERRIAAAFELGMIEAEIRRDCGSLLSLVSGGGAFHPGEHYPPGEVWDAQTHAQYFYHAHPDAACEPAEHGHFHLFLGRSGMPEGLAPLILPEMGLAPRSLPEARADPGTHRSARDRGVFAHLIGLSLGADGRPQALFTTNRWVTGETWYRSEDMARMLDRFVFATATATLLDRWLTAALAVLEPLVLDLMQTRDAGIMDWRRRRSRQHHVFEDRRLELVSRCQIDLDAEAAALRSSRG